MIRLPTAAAQRMSDSVIPPGLGFSDSTRLTQWTRWVIYVEILLNLYFCVDGLIAYLSGEDRAATAIPGSAREATSAVDTSITLLSLAAVVIIALWIYRANCNARRLGATGLAYSPSAAVAWYFVPIANLWKPYEAMRELWQASANPTAWTQQSVPPLVPWWWLLWILSGLLSTIVLFAAARSQTSYPVLTLISIVMNLVATLFFLRIVESIHFMQSAALQSLQSAAPSADAEGANRV
jgi:hypothetical protein